MLAPQVGYPCVLAPHRPDGFPAVVAAFLLAADRPASPAQRWQLVFEVARVFHVLAVTGRKKIFQPHIDADRRIDIPELGRLRQLSNRDHEPFISLALDRKRLDFAFHFAVQANPDRADVLDPQPAAFEPRAIAMAAVLEGIEAVTRFEARVAGLFPSLHPAEEILKGLIEPLQRNLRAAAIDLGEPFILFARGGQYCLLLRIL